jgi:cell division transport system permease protein
MAAKSITNKFRSTSVITIVSISLVLFILGLVALLIIDAQKITRDVKENADVEVFLYSGAKDADVTKLQKMLDASDYVKSTAYISKDSAAKQLESVDKEDFIGLLGYNPLPASINIHIKAEYANADSLAVIEKNLAHFPQVKEVVYQRSLIKMMNENLKKVTFVMLCFSMLLLLVSLTLINNTIRLTVYSKRFIIKTMQLVGATQSFIRRPFMWKGVRNGLIAAIIALLMIFGVIHMTQSSQLIPDLSEMNDVNTYFLLTGTVLLLGIIISWISTYFAVRRYLRLRSDDLHY